MDFCQLSNVSAFNTLSRFIHSFSSKEQAFFNFMAAVNIWSDSGAQENKVWHSFLCFPTYLPWSDGAGCRIFIFWILSFKPTFSLPSFTYIKRLFSSSSHSAIRVESSVHLRLLIFLPAILIPACVSSSPAFHIMYSAYKLNKQGDNIQPWRTPFPIWNQCVVPYPVLTAASWLAYRFFKRHSIVKGRDITLPTKVHLVKAMVFPMVMYGCESWTIKKAEHWRINDSELWCWRRLFFLIKAFIMIYLAAQELF